LQSTLAGAYDAFVARLGPTSGLLYSTFLGGSREETAGGIAVDALQDVYVTGDTNSADFPVAGTPVQSSTAGGHDAFLVRLAAGRSAFYTLTPCRIADTRGPTGASGGPGLAANTIRTFPVAGLCGIPSSATAIAFDVTVVDETDLGHLRIYPAGEPIPSAATLNFSALRTRANNAVIPLGRAGGVSVLCVMPPASTGRTHFVLDATGYFQ
jgi:hypothetical protein